MAGRVPIRARRLRVFQSLILRQADVAQQMRLQGGQTRPCPPVGLMGKDPVQQPTQPEALANAGQGAGKVVRHIHVSTPFCDDVLLVHSVL